MLYIFLIIGLLLVLWGVVSMIIYLIKFIINLLKKNKRKHKEVLNEIQIQKEVLLEKIDNNITIFEKLIEIFSMWYTALDAFRRSPAKLNKEKIKLKDQMDSILALLEINIIDLTNCKSKSNYEIEESFKQSEKSINDFNNLLDIMESDLEDLSSKWKFLIDEDKNNLGTLRKI